MVLPVAITSSTGTKSVGLLDLDSLHEIKGSVPKNKVQAYFHNGGYRKKDEDELDEINKNRSTSIGLDFALGCNKLLFGGTYVRRLSDNENGNRGFLTADPMNDYLNANKRETVLGCSTASVMKWGNEDVYEYELGVKRLDKGFLERITVWKNSKKAVSQLVVFKMKQNPETKRYVWFNWYGIQRITTGQQEFEIGNPERGEWTELNIEKESKDKPKYFAVWVTDPKETPTEESMLNGLGIRSKTDQKLFSSVARAEKQDDWHFNFFGPTQYHQAWGVDIHSYADNHKRYATYNSKIADEVAGFKGTWKNVKDFCESQGKREFNDLTVSDGERLRDYCYTHRPKITKKN